MRKEGLEPSRCYPQVPETCASTNSATFAGRAIVAAEVVIVKEAVAGLPCQGPVQNLSAPGRGATAALKATPEPPAARLTIPPPSHRSASFAATPRSTRNRLAAQGEAVGRLRLVLQE